MKRPVIPKPVHRAIDIRVRGIDRDDLPQMYVMQLDSESNRLAVTIPRTAEWFEFRYHLPMIAIRNVKRLFWN